MIEVLPFKGFFGTGGDDGEVTLECCTVVGHTARAVFIRCEDPDILELIDGVPGEDFRELTLPRSQILEGPDEEKSGARGDVTVTHWLARERGWVCAVD